MPHIGLYFKSIPPQTYNWKLNPFWLIAVPDLGEAGIEWDFFFQTNRDTAPFGVIWDSFKSHARMVLSQRISRYRKTSSQVIRQAEQSIADAEKNFTDVPSPSTEDHMKLQARIVNNLHFEKAERKIYYSKQRQYKCGERAGRLLAYLAHPDQRPPMVVSLHTTDSALLTDPDEVAGEFRSFFASLYSSATNNPRDEIVSLLSDIELPSLTQSQFELLEAPITEDEVAKAMSLLNLSKAPGSDSLPLEFYTTYSETLIPRLHELFYSIFESSSLPSSVSEAILYCYPNLAKI